MEMPVSPPILFKALRQLGLRPLALYALYKTGLWTGHYRRITDYRPQTIDHVPSSMAHRPSSVVYRPLFNLPPRDQLLHTLGQNGKTALLKEADEIVAGQVRLFGGDPVDLKLTGDWPLAHWTDFEKGTIKLEGDIKFIWEPARFGWAFTLGRAYHAAGDEKYAEAFWKYFEGFSEGNPAYLGPHWINGQEVAIRLMALAWAAQVFAASPASTPERAQRLTESIAAHAARIPPTLAYARAQNNNHLVTEAAALFTAGHVLPDHPDAENWRAMGWHWLNWAFRNQISTYGEYIQHSANYHRLMLQCALWVTAILHADRGRWPALTSEPLARASHWLFSLLDPSTGQVPNLGANDGAYIFPLAATRFDDHRPVVQAAARAFLRSGLPAGPWDEMSLWFGLDPHEQVVESDAYLTDHLRGRNSWAYLRASRFQSRLAHMDQLHFDLWWRGLNVAQDAGTYLYNAEPPWDNPLVSSRVHNTVTVDGRDQMTRAGRFLTLDWFPAYSKSVLEIDERIAGRVVAYHKAYRGIRHERTVTIYGDERWQVQDDLFTWPGRPRTFRLHWLLPDWDWELKNDEAQVEIKLKSPHGWLSLSVSQSPWAGSPQPRVSLIRAGELIYGQGQSLPFEGWTSPTYGQKIPALSLSIETSVPHGTQFLSEFIFPK